MTSLKPHNSLHEYALSEVRVREGVNEYRWECKDSDTWQTIVLQTPLEITALTDDAGYVHPIWGYLIASTQYVLVADRAPSNSGLRVDEARRRNRAIRMIPHLSDSERGISRKFAEHWSIRWIHPIRAERLVRLDIAGASPDYMVKNIDQRDYDHAELDIDYMDWYDGMAGRSTVTATGSLELLSGDVVSERHWPTFVTIDATRMLDFEGNPSIETLKQVSIKDGRIRIRFSREFLMTPGTLTFEPGNRYPGLMIVEPDDK